MLWDVFGAHVVGHVRGLCCGTTCSHCKKNSGAHVVGRVRGPCCGTWWFARYVSFGNRCLLYINRYLSYIRPENLVNLESLQTAIDFCSGAGACCNTLLAWRGPARSGKESDEEWRRVARRVTRNGEESVPRAQHRLESKGSPRRSCRSVDDFAERTSHLECDHDCIQAYVVGRVRGPCCGMTCPTQSPTRIEGVPPTIVSICRRFCRKNTPPGM